MVRQARHEILKIPGLILSLSKDEARVSCLFSSLFRRDFCEKLDQASPQLNFMGYGNGNPISIRHT
jgi:hypothetical protein